MWKVKYTKRLLKDLSKLSREVQTHAKKIVFDELLSTEPFELGYLEDIQTNTKSESGNIE